MSDQHYNSFGEKSTVFKDLSAEQTTVYFNNTKTAELTFSQSYSVPPMVQLTPNDTGNFPVSKTAVTTTGVTIRFNVKWTGSVDVLIIAK